MMKKLTQNLHRLGALTLAVLLSLQLSACSWFFMPGPVIITDEAETSSSAQEEPSGAAEESTAPRETTAADTQNASEAAAAESSQARSTAAPSAESSEEASSGSAEASTGSSETAPAESSQAQDRFTVDYFRTPECLRRLAGDTAFVDAYNLITACLAYKTEAAVNCVQEDAARILYIADTLCPLLKAFTNISEDSWADGKLSWSFYVDKVEFAIIRKEFEQQVAGYIEPVLSAGPELSETERALLLYHAYTEPASYNYEIISGAFKTRTEAEQHRIHSAYAGIVDHTGVCHDLAGGMTFLFIQAGFNACRMSVINEKDEHSWTLIELDGRYTCCDATWDVGGSFSYFGTSARERTESAGGSFRLRDMNIFDLNAPENFTIVNPGFERLQRFSRSAGTGTCISLDISTASSPHRLTFTSRAAGTSLRMACP